MGTATSGQHPTVQPGERYGRLAVLRRAGSDGGFRCYRCRCDCGAELVVRGGHLRSGNTTSCGCLRREHHAAAIPAALAPGTPIGILTVIEQAPNSGRHRRYVCRCACGVLLLLRADKLASARCRH